MERLAAIYAQIDPRPGTSPEAAPSPEPSSKLSTPESLPPAPAVETCSGCHDRGTFNQWTDNGIPGGGEFKKRVCKCVEGLDVWMEETRVPQRFRDMTMESFPVTDKTRPALLEINAWWMDMMNAEGRNSLLLTGRFGSGKTGLAVGLTRHYSEHGQWLSPALFFTVPSLLDAIRATYRPNAEHDEREIIDSVKDSPFLVLDDLGAERVTDWVSEKLFTVINHRHDEMLPTIFTSNLGLKQLADHIGERTTWRIAEMAKVIVLDGPNLRAAA